MATKAGRMRMERAEQAAAAAPTVPEQPAQLNTTRALLLSALYDLRMKVQEFINLAQIPNAPATQLEASFESIRDMLFDDIEPLIDEIAEDAIDQGIELDRSLPNDEAANAENTEAEGAQP